MCSARSEPAVWVRSTNQSFRDDQGRAETGALEILVNGDSAQVAGTTRGHQSSDDGSQVAASAACWSPERMSLTWSGVETPFSSGAPTNHTNGMPRRSA